MKIIKLIDILKEITEGKQVGTLYHFTSATNLIRILETNILKASNKWEDTPTVSLTRDKLGQIGGVGGSTNKEVRISLDGDKLSNKYKIRPYNFYKDKSPEDSEDEMEEVIFGDIKNIKDYIIEIELAYNTLNILPILATDRIKKLYPPGFKISNKIRRGQKFVSPEEVLLPLTDDVKKYIDNYLNKEKIDAVYEFPNLEMIEYFNQKLNTKYDSLSYDVRNYIEFKIK